MSIEIRGIENLNDQQRIDELINYVKIQLDDESDNLALMSNISSFIMATIKDLNWSGFYFYKQKEGGVSPRTLPRIASLYKT